MTLTFCCVWLEINFFGSSSFPYSIAERIKKRGALSESIDQLAVLAFTSVRCCVVLCCALLQPKPSKTRNKRFLSISSVESIQRIHRIIFIFPFPSSMVGDGDRRWAAMFLKKRSEKDPTVKGKKRKKFLIKNPSILMWAWAGPEWAILCVHTYKSCLSQYSKYIESIVRTPALFSWRQRTLGRSSPSSSSIPISVTGSVLRFPCCRQRK